MSAQFVVPSVMSPTKWCQRSLSVSERWKAHYVPDEVIEAIGKDCLAPLNRYLEPGRCYEDGARILLQNYNVITLVGDMHVPAVHCHPIQTHSNAPREVEMRSQVRKFDEEPDGKDDSETTKLPRFPDLEGRGVSTRAGKVKTFVPTMTTVLEDEEAAFARATSTGSDPEELDLDPKDLNVKATAQSQTTLPYQNTCGMTTLCWQEIWSASVGLNERSRFSDEECFVFGSGA